MKKSCLSCEAIRNLTSDYSDPSLICPSCRIGADAPQTTQIPALPKAPFQCARKRKDDDDEDADDEDVEKRSTAGGDVATAAGAAAGAAGLGVGMILLIVGGLITCCVCVPVGGVGIFAWVAVPKIKAAAEQTQTRLKLMQIGMACHVHHDTTRSLPSPRMQPLGPNMPSPELSWRVTVLNPTIDQGLFNSFDKSQAWNVGKNNELQNRMPHQYMPNNQIGGSQTFFQYFTGQKTMFPDPLTKVAMPKDIPDGTSNTIMVAEAANSVVWSKPADIALPPAGAVPVSNDKFMAVMVDGSVRIIQRRNANDAVLRQLIDPRDGGALPAGWDQ